MSEFPPPSYPPPSTPPPGPWGVAYPPGPAYPPSPAHPPDPMGPMGPMGPGQAPPASSGSSRVPLLVGVTVAVVAVVAAGLWFMREDSPYPSEWDERVVDLVDFVEDERGHEFGNPVYVDFLTEEQYSEQTRGDVGELSEEEEAEIARVEGTMRALGLVQGDFDLFESTNDVADTGTLAFYDLQTERIVVRGTEVTPRLAATLVHELTHALQHQAFLRTDLMLDPGDATSGALLAMRGLVEGDANRIETAYVEGLPADEQAEIDEANEDGLDDLDEEEIPEALLATFGMPYALGDGFVAAMEAEGRTAIDRAFNDPPTTEEHMLVPRTYLDGDQPHVVSVSPPEDVEVLEEGDFGAASLMLVLGSRIDARDALRAAIGWGGDEYVVYEQDGQTCIDMVVSTDSDQDSLELAAALTAWVAAGPDGAASTGVDGEDLTLHACDPGEDAPAEVEGASPMGTLTLGALRSLFVSEAISGGAPQEVADCYADAVLDSFTVEEITGDEPPADLQARLQAAAAGCS